MATVLRVRTVYGKEVYAVKAISKSTEEGVESAFREKKFLSTVRSMFVVKMRATFQDEHTLYILMELIEGKNLRECLFSYPQRLNESEVKFITVQLIEALNSLHSNEILHRDFKPENIIVSSSGYVKLIDLGISTVNNSRTPDGTY